MEGAGLAVLLWLVVGLIVVLFRCAVFFRGCSVYRRVPVFERCLDVEDWFSCVELLLLIMCLGAFVFGLWIWDLLV